MHKIYSLHYTTKYMNTYMVWCTREQRGSQRLNHRPSNQQMMFCSTTWATGVYSVREAVSSVGADSLSFLCVWRFWTFERLTQVWRRWHVLQLVTNLKKMSVTVEESRSLRLAVASGQSVWMCRRRSSVSDIREAKADPSRWFCEEVLTTAAFHSVSSFWRRNWRFSVYWSAMWHHAEQASPWLVSNNPGVVCVSLTTKIKTRISLFSLNFLL